MAAKEAADVRTVLEASRTRRHVLTSIPEVDTPVLGGYLYPASACAFGSGILPFGLWSSAREVHRWQGCRRRRGH